ncbi:hypothetical protein OE88DRAFT_1656110 [Heliocybe sulcata]|uniref:Uncharacterized protein n=1 Tax=Heliocybe sulcata TaxID=5364 RepID=A0A5C3NBI1_9AGAM|nr:hypothetical protein OE88DRAFT_1656110 [Heliocybe sulcata]
MTSKPESQHKYDGRSAVKLCYGLQVSVSPASTSNTFEVHPPKKRHTKRSSTPKPDSLRRNQVSTAPAYAGTERRAYERSASLSSSKEAEDIVVLIVAEGPLDMNDH